MSEKQLEHKDKNWEVKCFPISVLLHDFTIKLNVGSIFRLADAFGCEHVYLTGDTPVPPHRKITKTSRSAEKYVDYSYSETASDILSKLKKQNYTIVALELTDQSIELEELKFTAKEKICLLLGSENEGISSELLAASDISVHIPMHGQTTSLNVATAAGIALYKINSLLSF